MARTQEIYQILVETSGSTAEVKALVNELNAANRTIRETKKATAGGVVGGGGTSNIEAQKKSMQEYGRVVQNVGFQLQDFIVQVQGGTSVTRAFGQQFPQVIGAFTGLGIGLTIAASALASVIALLPTLVAGFRSLTGAAKPLTETLKAFSDQVDRAAGARKLAVDVTALADAFGRVTPQLENIADLQALYEMNRLLETGTETTKSLAETVKSTGSGGLLGQGLLGVGGGKNLADELRNIQGMLVGINNKPLQGAFKLEAEAAASAVLQKNLGLTLDQALAIDKALDDISKAKSFDQQATAITRLKELLFEAAVESKSAWAENVLSTEGVVEAMDAIIARQVQVNAQQNAINATVKATLSDFTARKIAAEQELQYGQDTLKMLELRQGAERNILINSQAYLAASEDQRAEMLRVLKAAQGAEYALAKMKEETEKASRAAKGLAGAFNGPVINAINTAIGRAKLLAGTIASAAGALGRLQSAANDKAFDVQVLRETNALRAQGAAVEDIAAAEARLYAQRDAEAAVSGLRRYGRLGNFVADNSVKILGDQAAQTAKDLELAQQEKERLLSAVDGGDGGGGGGGASEQMKDLEAAIKLVQSALDDSLTPAEEAAQKQAELAAALQLVANSGEFSAAELERVRQYMIQLGQDTDGVKDALNAVEGGLNSMFDGLISGTESVKDAFANMVQSILADIAKMLISRQITSLVALLGGYLGNAGGLFNTPIFGGGASTRGIAPPVDVVNLASVSRAAPSGSAGSLRLGGDVYVNVQNRASDAEVRVEETTTASGERQIDVLIERKMKELVGRGALDRAFAQSYGMKRRPA